MGDCLELWATVCDCLRLSDRVVCSDELGLCANICTDVRLCATMCDSVHLCVTMYDYVCLFMHLLQCMR